jgi:16S rRNA (cytosine1402-N4)-methyltransferase
MMSPEKKNIQGDKPYHIPVLLHTASSLLIANPDGIYVDLTFGGGGHSGEILNRLSEKGKLIAFDRDRNVPLNQKKLKKDKRFFFVNADFRYFPQYLHYMGIQEADGILADLGISSAQVDHNKRGFSYFSDEALDMRMNQKQSLTAEYVVNRYAEEELIRIFRDYGELPNARKLAAYLCSQRLNKPFRTCKDLADRLSYLAGKEKKEKFLAKLFQAIRMEVNDEYAALREMLENAGNALKMGGRMVVISYHSLEDRLVKNLFRTGNTDGVMNIDPIKGSAVKYWKEITHKPIVPDAEEVKNNPRSRSAKLRCAEKILNKE